MIGRRVHVGGVQDHVCWRVPQHRVALLLEYELIALTREQATHHGGRGTEGGTRGLERAPLAGLEVLRLGSLKVLRSLIQVKAPL